MKLRTVKCWLQVICGCGIFLFVSPALAAKHDCAAHTFGKVRSFKQEAPAIVCDMAHRRLLVIGEIHGTKQTPAFVAQLVRDASRNRPVRLGIEFIHDLQAPIQKFLRSKGTPADHDALFKIGYWSDKDGRTSVAMQHMVETLRRLRAEGRDVDIFTMKPNWPGQAVINKAGGVERFVNHGMADAVRRHMTSSKPDTLVIAYMGNAHSTINPWATKPDPVVTAQLADFHPTLLVLHEHNKSIHCHPTSPKCKALRLMVGAPMHGAYLRRIAPIDGARAIEVAMPRYTDSPPVLKHRPRIPGK